VNAFVPTPEQQRILAYEPGTHARVLAGPGTGKSATLVALIDRLLEGEPSPRIRLLTFTRAATGELAKKVAEHPAAAAERPSTIHSFAISVLLRNPGTGGFPEPLRIADPWEYANLVRPTLARRAGVGVRELDRLVREMPAAWESLEPEEDPRVDPHTRARFLGAWDEHRRTYGYTLLAELPYALRQALIDHPDLDGADYNLLVVDEYQDLNVSVSQRCGSRIIQWAMFVIEGDPERPPRPRLGAADEAPRERLPYWRSRDKSQKLRASLRSSRS
jgi:DNA helicase-2/ATP-dependent DNA helicase PcrA